mmetsp:Transcript_13398/g.25660  ORF Transcript_13398/g.25660 Transcript_13398/m.25660 type:complete len:148 (+) Transcript_13398:248-691(+)
MSSSSSQLVLNLPTNQTLQGLQDVALFLGKFEEIRTEVVKAEAKYTAATKERDGIIKEIKDAEKQYETKDWQEKYNALQASATRLGPFIEAAEKKMSACESHYKEMLTRALHSKDLCEQHGISIEWDPYNASTVALVTNVSLAPMAQ